MEPHDEYFSCLKKNTSKQVRSKAESCCFEIPFLKERAKNLVQQSPKDREHTFALIGTLSLKRLRESDSICPASCDARRARPRLLKPRPKTKITSATPYKLTSVAIWPYASSHES